MTLNMRPNPRATTAYVLPIMSPLTSCWRHCSMADLYALSPWDRVGVRVSPAFGKGPHPRYHSLSTDARTPSLSASLPAQIHPTYLFTGLHGTGRPPSMDLPHLEEIRVVRHTQCLASVLLCHE